MSRISRYSILVACLMAVLLPVKSQPVSTLSSTRNHHGLVLSYHQVRNWNDKDPASAKTYIIPITRFKEHMRVLYDSGYKTILPDEYLSRLQTGQPLEKRFILSFDDGTLSQYENALPVLEQYGFKAVFFIMTVTLNRPRYMSSAQVRTLAERGHVIGCHTWDHHSVSKYKPEDWEIQLYKPRKQLQQISGQQVKYFAYPFGTWTKASITHLQRYHYEAAFQLAGEVDTVCPQFTVRRLLVDGYWNATTFMSQINKYLSRLRND